MGHRKRRGAPVQRERQPVSHRPILEKRRRSASPVLAFLLGDSFHVFHVSSSLRQYVVQVVTNADKRKAFLQKLTHTRRAKQKESQDDMVLPGILNSFLRGCSQFRRRVHV